MLNPTQTELLATTHVTEVFASCKRICPFINTSDKEPLWDGFLYLYDTEEHNNETLRGRVSCQVKGKGEITEPEKESFYLTKGDLSNYLRDGGILFFVVHVGNQTKPSYWAKLTPLKLRHYLKELEDSSNKGISIELNRMPVDLEQCEAETFEFYQHCQLQKAPPVSAEQIAKPGSRFRIFGVYQGDVHPIVALSKGFHYLYSCDEDDNVTNVVGDSEYSFKVSGEIDDRILVGGKEFRVPVKVVVADGASHLEVGAFMKVDLIAQEGKDRKVFYYADEIKGVRQRALALQVLLALNESSEFSFPAFPSPMSCSAVQIPEDKLASIQDELRNVLRVVSLLDRLHITSDIDLDSLSKKDMAELNTLYRAVMENKTVHPNLTGHDIWMTYIDIGKMKILVWLIKAENGYNVRDFFAPVEQEITASDSESGERFSISRFSILETKDYMYASNIDWELIPSDYKDMRIDVPAVSERINQDQLNLLTAYDKTGRREILDAALRLSNWLLEAGQGTAESQIYRINNLQTLKRMRQLTEEELQEITRYSEESTASVELKYCCALLLDNQRRARIHFESLQKKQQAFYKSLPISHFKKW